MKVTIIDTGYVYATYKKAADRAGATEYKRNRTPQKGTYKVMGFTYHHNEPGVILLLIGVKNQYIIGSEGVKFSNKKDLELIKLKLIMRGEL